MIVERIKDLWDYSDQDFEALETAINHEDWGVILDVMVYYITPGFE